MAKISIFLKENLLSGKHRTKFAKIFGGKLSLLVSLISYKSHGFRVLDTLKIRPREGGEIKWQN